MAVDLHISRTDDDFAARTYHKRSSRRQKEHRPEDYAEALAMVRDMPGLENKKSTVVYNPKWHKGVV